MLGGELSAPYLRAAFEMALLDVTGKHFGVPVWALLGGRMRERAGLAWGIYQKSPEEMAALFADLPEALENSVEIARRCTLVLKFGENHLPDYPVPDGVTVTEHLRNEAEAGLRCRFETQGASQPVEDYQKRLDYELAIIERMGFVGREEGIAAMAVACVVR